jgi:hypothetical protein
MSWVYLTRRVFLQIAKGTKRVSGDEYKKSIDELLKGRTMGVYALLLTHGPMGVRDVQRALGLSSPSLALHHLNKLAESELVAKDEYGVYSVVKQVRVGSLTLFVKIGTRLIPRFVFLITLFSSMLVLYVAFLMSWPLRIQDIMYISMAVIGISVLLYEASKMWLLKPF